MKLTDLGFSSAEIKKKIVDQCVRELLDGVSGSDEDGDPYQIQSELRGQFDKQIKEAVDARIAEVFEKECKSNIIKFMEDFTLQETNSWGEKKGKKLTFTEYFIERINAYISEEVDYRGKTKAQEGYNWSPHSTRIVHVMHEHFQYQIENAVKESAKVANAEIAGGIQKAVKIALDGITSKLNVTIK